MLQHNVSTLWANPEAVAPPAPSYGARFTPPPEVVGHALPPAADPLLHSSFLPCQGALAAFSLVFVSEVCDKTFFLCMSLAAKLGRGVTWAGTMLALAGSCAISISLGSVSSLWQAAADTPAAPGALAGRLSLGELAGIVALGFFGVSALRKAAAEGAFSSRPGRWSSSSSCCSCGHSSSSGSSSSSSLDGSSLDGGSLDGSSLEPSSEFAEAQHALAAAERKGRCLRRRGAWATTVLEVASLIFVAELADRSMLATIAISAGQQSVLGVGLGALAAYAAASGLAVLGGALAARHVSDAAVDCTSGVLFLLFAAGSAAGSVLR